MAVVEFQPKLPPASAPYQFAPKTRYSRIVRTLFAQHTVLLAAAACQLLFCLVLLDDFAIVPSAILLLAYAVTTLIRHLTPASSTNPYTAHVFPGLTTSQLPSSSGVFGPVPASQGLVVFNLGVQINHPLGIACPGGKEMVQRFMAMYADLMRRRDELGIISISRWKGGQIETATSLNTFYFRDVESIHEFAHEEMHRKAWDWYNKNDFGHIGIFHETFCVAPNSYETIYGNCTPVGLGRGSVRCKDLKSDHQWLSTLVSAETPALRIQVKRMNRGPLGVAK